jgi:hypothetical protein
VVALGIAVVVLDGSGEDVETFQTAIIEDREVRQCKTCNSIRSALRFFTSPAHPVSAIPPTTNARAKHAPIFVDPTSDDTWPALESGRVGDGDRETS